MPRYLAVDIDGYAAPILDVFCGDCHRAGDPNPPRLARFQRVNEGEVGLEDRWAAGDPALFRPGYLPTPHRRPDGGTTWQLRCPHGHNRPMRAEWLFAVLKHLGNQDYIRFYF